MKTKLQLLREARSAKIRATVTFTGCAYCGKEIPIEKRDRYPNARFCCRSHAKNYYGTWGEGKFGKASQEQTG